MFFKLYSYVIMEERIGDSMIKYDIKKVNLDFEFYKMIL